MILVDANLLLYAYNQDAPEHAAARSWLEVTLSAPTPFGLSWQTILAFIRISTNKRAFPQPLSVQEATEIVAQWLDRPSVTILQPGERHWALLVGMLRVGQASGPLAMDAHLAALAVEHGATLYSTDRDFARFVGLNVANPLQS
jgi:toxin-antitoxin system PIN domain toxin